MKPQFRFTRYRKCGIKWRNFRCLSFSFYGTGELAKKRVFIGFFDVPARAGSLFNMLPSFNRRHRHISLPSQPETMIIQSTKYDAVWPGQANSFACLAGKTWSACLKAIYINAENTGRPGCYCKHARRATDRIPCLPSRQQALSAKPFSQTTPSQLLNGRLVDMVYFARHNVRRDHRSPALCVWNALVVWTWSACNQPPSGDEATPFD